MRITLQHLLSAFFILAVACCEAGAETGWSSLGPLPFSAVDIAVIKTDTNYVMYYTAAGLKAGRAFSTDLRTWTPDTADFCSNAGELCSAIGGQQPLGHRPIVRLPDGRYRLFRASTESQGKVIKSFISTDALRWTLESGIRLTSDPASIFERGPRSFVGLTLIYLPDGRLRMYYGGHISPTSPGTDPIYQGCNDCGVILSAISSDNGLTFVREPGARVNPRFLGPVSDTGVFHVIGFSVVATAEGFRLYTTASEDGAVTYVSRDGLAFTLEGQIPALGSDIATVVMADSRLWLVSSMLTGAGEFAHMMVYGSQPFVVSSTRWDRTRQSAALSLKGTFTEPVTLNILNATAVCPGISTPATPYCPWRPEYYQGVAATIAAPTETVRYAGPSPRPDSTSEKQLLVEVVSGNTRAMAAIYCMIQLGSGVTPFCTDQPLTARPASTSSTFSIATRGGASTTTDGVGNLTTGYARIEPSTGSATPSGIAIFGFRSGGVLVSETAVPDSPALTSGRIYAEVSADASVNTGIAFANPNTQTATIDYRFTNTEGTDFRTGAFKLEGGKQFAEFLNGSRFNSGTGIQGTFSFTSTVAVSVIALRGFTNQRGEFLMTTLPVVDTSNGAPGLGSVRFVPHFADGGGWTTQILLVNPTSSALSGTIDFIVNGQAASSSTYSIRPGSSQKIVTPGLSTNTTSGLVRIAGSASTPAPTPLAVFSYKPANVTITEAGAAGMEGSTLRTYVESVGSIQSGIAIANTVNQAANVTLELFALDGSAAGSTTLSLPALGQIARFLPQFFPDLPASFQGVLRISSITSVAVTGLRSRTNERGDFLITTTPPTSESPTPSAGARVFPHLVNGGGYTTQFILYNSATGQAPVGELRFYGADGSALNLRTN